MPSFLQAYSSEVLEVLNEVIEAVNPIRERYNQPIKEFPKFELKELNLSKLEIANYF